MLDFCQEEKLVLRAFYKVAKGLCEAANAAAIAAAEAEKAEPVAEPVAEAETATA
jgi:hypothetical protein